LQELEKLGQVKRGVVVAAMEKYRIEDISAAEAGNTEGSG